MALWITMLGCSIAPSQPADDRRWVTIGVVGGYPDLCTLLDQAGIKHGEDGSVYYSLEVPEEQADRALELLLRNREGKAFWWFRTRAEATEALLASRLFQEAYEKGLGYWRKKDLDRAIACFSVALRIEPDNVDTLLERAKLQEETGNLNGAIADFEKALTLATSDHARRLLEKITELKSKKH